VRNTIEAFNREGVEAALAYFDPDVEWLGPPEWLEEHLYKGQDGIREIAAVWGENCAGLFLLGGGAAGCRPGIAPSEMDCPNRPRASYSPVGVNSRNSTPSSVEGTSPGYRLLIG
jgi:hypothetical protein